MDAGREFLKDYNRDNQEVLCTISDTERTAIENCVFQHKSILIGNKTLKDTVLPKQHWTLKQASRAGCSCCGPDPYDEEMEETREESTLLLSSLSMSRPVASEMNQIITTARKLGDPTTMAKTSIGYVDGKTRFAFDPTKFAHLSAS
jgi:hypothetical protein